MVHRMDSLPESPVRDKSTRRRLAVKSELDDSDSDSGFDDYVIFSKRPKFDFSTQVEGVALTELSPLEEPSPLGLKLKKSPSLLDLIQMRLSQEKGPSLAKTLARKEEKNAAIDKLKASNFPASLLKIGSWEYTSRYEGDLVAKCYFAKHKLVWEVLDGGLKNKIEIQWSDIMAINAKYPDNEPESLDVVLARQPLFFREINPQPRKHTLWQATTDFTSGQATIQRQHHLQFPQGTLYRHFEKLMQCDFRLRFLSQQPEKVLESPYFQPMVSIYGESSDCDPGFALKADGRFTFSSFTDSVSVSGLSSSDIDNHDRLILSARQKSQGYNNSISETFPVEGEISSKMNEARGLNLLNQIKLPGLHSSMSVGDLVTHISDCISEQMKSDNPNHTVNEYQKMNILEEISQYLLNDAQTTIPLSDEKTIMSRVNSLCCLLQRDALGPQNLPLYSENATQQTNGDDVRDKSDTSKSVNKIADKLSVEAQNNHGNTSSMVRKDSFGELLLHLPRIASLPQFLISVPEDPSEL